MKNKRCVTLRKHKIESLIPFQVVIFLVSSARLNLVSGGGVLNPYSSHLEAGKPGVEEHVLQIFWVGADFERACT